MKDVSGRSWDYALRLGTHALILFFSNYQKGACTRMLQGRLGSCRLFAQEKTLPSPSYVRSILGMFRLFVCQGSWLFPLNLPG